MGYPALRLEAEELRSAGVAFADLGDVFATVPGNIFIDHCCHMNAAGVSILVDHIAAAVAAGPPPTPQP